MEVSGSKMHHTKNVNNVVLAVVMFCTALNAKVIPSTIVLYSKDRTFQRAGCLTGVLAERSIDLVYLRFIQGKDDYIYLGLE